MGSRFRFLGYSLVSLSFIFIFRRVYKSLNDIPSFEVTFVSVTVILIGVLLCASVTLALSLAWMVLLKSRNIQISSKQAYIIMGKSQIARYLPGNVLHYAGRVVLGKQAGIPAGITVLSTGVETVLIIIIACMIVLAGLSKNNKMINSILYSFFSIDGYKVKIISLSILIFLFLCAILAVIFRIYLKDIFRAIWRTKKIIQARLLYFNVRHIALASCCYLTIFLILGINIPFMLRFIWGVTTDWEWYQFVWSFTTAWIVGFITPGAPGGLGLREVVLLSLYTPILGEGLALGLSLMLRVMTSLGDFVAFALALYLGRRLDNKA